MRRYRRPRAGTLRKLLEDYRRSPQWAALRPNTRTVYEMHLALLRSRIGDEEVSRIRRRDIVVLVNEIAGARGNGTANVFKSVASRVMSFAVDLEYREANPVSRVPSLPIGEYHRLTDDEVKALLDKAPPEMRRTILLALYTGQRRGDLLAARWDHFEAGGIHFRQQKTGTAVWVPMHHILAEDMVSWPKVAVTILADHRGQPWQARAFTHAWDKLRKAAGVDKQFHGFRKTAAAKLAEAGCSTHELAAITGHKSLKMLEHYTREADQRRRALTAMEKFSNGSGTAAAIGEI